MYFRLYFVFASISKDAGCFYFKGVERMGEFQVLRVIDMFVFMVII